MIRYLKQEEKNATRNMYEENFPEDTPEFVDYYYQLKTKNNQILVMEEDFLRMAEYNAEYEDAYQTMLHLNPIKLFIQGEILTINYIVAVATKKDHRKQGKMALLMEQALNDMQKKGQPFTILMPANYKVYLSSGFRFIQKGNQNVNKIQSQSDASNLSLEDIQLKSLKHEDIMPLIEFMNQELKQRYHIFVYRDPAYYQTLLEELKSVNGEIIIVKKDNKIIGSFLYGRDGLQTELREPIFQKNYEIIMNKLIDVFFKNCPIILSDISLMARITNLKTCIPLIKSTKPVNLKVKVKDEIIAQNCGNFHLSLTENESFIKTITEKEVEKEMDIAQLTEVLFQNMNVFIQEWV